MQDVIADKAYMPFYMHGTSHWLGLDDPDQPTDCDPETWHLGGYYDGSDLDV